MTDKTVIKKLSNGEYVMQSHDILEDEMINPNILSIKSLGFPVSPGQTNKRDDDSDKPRDIFNVKVIKLSSGEYVIEQGQLLEDGSVDPESLTIELMPSAK